MPASAARTRWLAALLRLGGCLTGSAFLAMLLPVSWMAATHEWLGLGPFPHTPVVEYLARSAALLYGSHGVLLLVIASDPVRYRPLIWYLAALTVVIGSTLIAIDAAAGMPIWWTLGEGPPIAALGIVIAILNRSTPAR